MTSIGQSPWFFKKNNISLRTWYLPSCSSSASRGQASGRERPTVSAYALPAAKAKSRVRFHVHRLRPRTYDHRRISGVLGGSPALRNAPCVPPPIRTRRRIDSDGRCRTQTAGTNSACQWLIIPRPTGGTELSSCFTEEAVVCLGKWARFDWNVALFTRAWIEIVMRELRVTFTPAGTRRAHFFAQGAQA
jgi:hypothetical protein